ncbi:hypothetical protein EDD85DRAFT_790038 [Armillaria nabsnona]|nr:hypothetical protein EDD85DRAFT_790038 [Armillaria nabsnona]
MGEATPRGEIDIRIVITHVENGRRTDVVVTDGWREQEELTLGFEEGRSAEGVMLVDIELHLEKVLPLSPSSIVGIPVILPLSCSFPHIFVPPSVSHILPMLYTIASHPPMQIIYAYPTVVIVLVVGFAIRASSCSKMGADMQSSAGAEVLEVHKCCVCQGLVLMLMSRVLSQGQALSSLLNDVGSSFVVGQWDLPLPHWKTYEGVLGSESDAIKGSWGPRMRRKDLNEVKSSQTKKTYI